MISSILIFQVSVIIIIKLIFMVGFSLRVFTLLCLLYFLRCPKQKIHVMVVAILGTNVPIIFAQVYFGLCC